jgi:histidinol-phosphate aminotransferase
MLAVMAATEAVRDTEYIRNYVSEVLAGRELLCEGFGRLGIPFFRSQANFVLMRTGERSIEVRDRLREMGVLVRDRSYEIPGCVRVTAGTREQVRTFLKALEEVW